MTESTLAAALTEITFRGLRANADFYEALSLPVISTGRSFAYYRRIFFENQSQRTVLEALTGKCVVDVGCGLTPYVSDSMFQVCRKKDVEFYGVDPKFAEGFSLSPLDIAKIRAVGGRGRICRRPAGLERCLAASADDLPFPEESVDLILSNFLLYAWIQDADVLERIYREFHRVLVSVGEVRIYPAPYMEPNRIRHRGLREAMGLFDIRQRFSARLLNPGQYPPAYVLSLRKRQESDA